MNSPYVKLSVSSVRTEPCPIDESPAIVKDARKNVGAMDKIDGHTIAETHIDSGLRTVMSALEYAIGTQAWDGVAESLIMIQQIECMIRRAAKYRQDKIADGN